jgi:hypothetical protein
LRRMDFDQVGADQGPPEPAAQCAICFESHDDLVEMPCCGRAGSSTRFCFGCVQIVCQLAGAHGVGRCPNCRECITADAEARAVRRATLVGACAVCRQQRTIVEERGGHALCGACAVGLACAILYECEGCGRAQRIPHPMWRYQPTPTAFGTDTWACHVGCGAQTHWRVASEADAAAIPLQELPESWGRREDWMEAVRAERERRRQLAPPPQPRWRLAPRGGLPVAGWSQVAKWTVCSVGCWAALFAVRAHFDLLAA